MADNEHPAYVPVSWLWNHLIENDNQLQCRYCKKVWFKGDLGPSTSTIRLHMAKHHFEQVYANI